MITKGWVQNAQVFNPFNPWLRIHSSVILDAQNIIDSLNRLHNTKNSRGNILMCPYDLVFRSKMTKCFHTKFSYLTSLNYLDTKLSVRSLPYPDDYYAYTQRVSVISISYLLFEKNMYLAFLNRYILDPKEDTLCDLYTRKLSTDNSFINEAKDMSYQLLTNSGQSVIYNLYRITGSFRHKNNIYYCYKGKLAHYILNFHLLSPIDLDNKIAQGKDKIRALMV